MWRGLGLKTEPYNTTLRMKSYGRGYAVWPAKVAGYIIGRRISNFGSSGLRSVCWSEM